MNAGPLLVIVWLVGGAVAVGSAIWVYVDASKLGVTKDRVQTKSFELSTDLSPAGWAVSVFLVWIVAFPLYLAKRQSMIESSHRPSQFGGPQQGYPQFGGPQFGGPQFGVQVPPGWYPDPFTVGRHRWWDGHQWTAHQA